MFGLETPTIVRQYGAGRIGSDRRGRLAEGVAPRGYVSGRVDEHAIAVVVAQTRDEDALVRIDAGPVTDREAVIGIHENDAAGDVRLFQHFGVPHGTSFVASLQRRVIV